MYTGQWAFTPGLDRVIIREACSLFVAQPSAKHQPDRKTSPAWYYYRTTRAGTRKERTPRRCKSTAGSKTANAVLPNADPMPPAPLKSTTLYGAKETGFRWWNEFTSWMTHSSVSRHIRSIGCSPCWTPPLGWSTHHGGTSMWRHFSVSCTGWG